jgi:hypothetical protein
MKLLLFAAALALLEVRALSAQEVFFSESEIYQALSWGMPDSVARKLAKDMSDDPRAETYLERTTDLGPIAVVYSKELLLLLSLVSDETNRKVERRLIETRSGAALTKRERADWEQRRAELRNELVKAGKLKA